MRRENLGVRCGVSDFMVQNRRRVIQRKCLLCVHCTHTAVQLRCGWLKGHVSASVQCPSLHRAWDSQELDGSCVAIGRMDPSLKPPLRAGGLVSLLSSVCSSKWRLLVQVLWTQTPGDQTGPVNKRRDVFMGELAKQRGLL